MNNKRTFFATLAVAMLPAFANAQTAAPALPTMPAMPAMPSMPAMAAPAASPAPAPPNVPSAAEQPFVTKAATDLEAMYPTAADAEKAGYVRYTLEDKSGSISYANDKWTSTDADHPSQLWYSAAGKLLGADYSVPYSDAKPSLWSIEPARWQRFGAHVHFGLVQADGSVKFGATGGKKFTATGGDLANPTAAQLVAAGIAKNASDVKFVFPFPKIWDLEVWVLPNPSGAFAELNPTVKPVHPTSDDM